MSNRGSSTGGGGASQGTGRASAPREGMGRSPDAYGTAERRLQEADTENLGEPVEDELRDRRSNGLPDPRE